MHANPPGRSERRPWAEAALAGKKSGAERRTEPRRDVEGEVRLRPFGTMAGTFTGHLLDLAASGFRARHSCVSMTSGQLVDFQMAAGRGIARAVWTRIVDGAAETGFHILQSGE
jgi:hypothetical protein